MNYNIEEIAWRKNYQLPERVEKNKVNLVIRNGMRWIILKDKKGTVKRMFGKNFKAKETKKC